MKSARPDHNYITSHNRLNQKSKKEQGFHVKILITITLSVALSIIVVSTLLYVYFENSIVEKIYESEKNNLFQAGVSTRLMQELSKSIAIQMYNDFALSGLFFKTLDDPVEIYNAITDFRKYKDLIPYIHSIYIFNPINNTFYINSAAKTVMIQSGDTFFDTDIITMLDNPDYFNSLIPIPRIISEPGVTRDLREENGVYTFIFNLSGIRSKDHSGNIIINISEKWVRDIIDSVDINPDIQVLIIDKDDRLLISDTNKSMLSKAYIYDYIKDRLTLRRTPRNNNPQTSGSLLFQLKNERIFLVFSLIESFDWIFVKLIPYDHIMSDVYRIRINLIIIALIILLIGTMFSLLFANRVYKPIDVLLKKLARIEEERKTDTLVLKQYDLGRLFTQSKNLSDYELTRFLEDLHIGKNNNYIVLLLEIDNYAQFCIRYSKHEQNLLRLGLLDAAKELLQKKYQNEGIDIGNNHLIFLLNINDEQKDLFQAEIGALSKEIQKKIETVFTISVSIIISGISRNSHDISLLYENVLEMVQSKYFLGCGVVINETYLNNNKINKHAFVYPYEKEKNLIEAIQCADNKKVNNIYNDIIDSTLPYGYNAIVTTRNTIAYAVNKLINKLKQQNLLDFSFNFYQFFSNIISCETIEETNILFRKLFDKVIGAIEKRNRSNNYSLITRIIATIENEYMDINLGISTLAYKYKLSAAYLGRLFKKYTGKSMPDYINELRINNANELLRDTTYSMSKIMEMTGFTNKTHFYNMFKKYNGLTPRIYRQTIIDGKNTN